MLRRAGMAVICCTGLLWACRESIPAAVPLRLNDLQVLGSHNSYKKAIQPALFERLLDERGPERIRGLEYGHVSLSEQLDLGLRKLELDVFYDPRGGLYADPSGLEPAERSTWDEEGLMAEPGFKVLHVQDIDFRSSCPTLKRCLEKIVAWSDLHPRHLPIVVSMNTKDSSIEGLSEPLAFDEAAFEALDGALLETLGRGRLITPDDVRGDYVTLREAVLANQWPTIDESRGKLLFVLDEGGAKLERYVAGHASLAGRVMFANAPPESPEAGFLIINDPIRDGKRIRSLVVQGFLVRTRADADTVEARSGNTDRLAAALVSGAQFISTDYYLADSLFGTGYRASLGSDGVVRCNPGRQQPDCGIVE